MSPTPPIRLKSTIVGNTQQNPVQIGTGLSVAANLPGSSIFSQSGANVFTALQVAGHSPPIRRHLQHRHCRNQRQRLLSSRRYRPGLLRQHRKRTHHQRDFLSQEKINISTYENTLVSADTATAATNVTQAETVLTATVAAAAQMNQQANLLNYIQD